jgi:hypothetical protein
MRCRSTVLKPGRVFHIAEAEVFVVGGTEMASRGNGGESYFCPMRTLPLLIPIMQISRVIALDYARKGGGLIADCAYKAGHTGSA